MSWLLKSLLFLAALTSSFSSRAASLSFKNDLSAQTELRDLREVLKTSRVELYLLFLRQQENPSVPIQRLVSSTPNIFDLLKKVRVYEPPASAPCRDQFGNEVDSASVSPEPDSICVSLSRLVAKLDPEQARSRLLALMAGEYARYLGFNDEDAWELQGEVFQLVQKESRLATLKMLKVVIENHYMIRGAIFSYRFGSHADPSWDHLCKIATNMQKYFSLITRADHLKSFSAFSPRQKVLLDTFAGKSKSVFMGTCGQSESYPSSDRQELWSQYQTIFGTSRTISAQKFGSYFGKRKIDPFVTYRQMETFDDFGLELIEIENYVTDYLKFDFENIKQ